MRHGTMLVRALQRLPWQLTCALFAMVVSADIQPSTSKTGVDFGGQIVLQDSQQQNISTLVPLSQEATSRGVRVAPGALAHRD